MQTVIYAERISTRVILFFEKKIPPIEEGEEEEGGTPVNDESELKP